MFHADMMRETATELANALESLGSRIDTAVMRLDSHKSALTEHAAELSLLADRLDAVDGTLVQLDTLDKRADNHKDVLESHVKELDLLEYRIVQLEGRLSDKTATVDRAAGAFSAWLYCEGTLRHTFSASPALDDRIAVPYLKMCHRCGVWLPA